jgi:cobalt-zinc-cadmium resistance protein CzcA
MQKLIHFALHRRGFVIGGTLLLMVAGFWALQRIPFDAFPDLTGTRVEVITVAPGMAPEEVERLITYPVESALMGIPGAEGVRSTSKFGLSLITVPFPDGTNVYFARQLVQQRLSDAKGALPPGIEPALGPVSTPMGELYQFVLSSDSLSLTQLKTINDYVIRPRLRTVPGVSEVNSWGGLVERIEVTVDPVRLAARRLTLSDVHDALARNTMAFGGSYLEQAGERYTLRGLGRVENPAEIERVVVTAPGGAAVRIGEIATVQLGALPRNGAVTKDGNGEVVSGMVLKLQGADSRKVIAAVKARMQEIEKALPPNVTVTPFYDQTELVSRTTTTIVKNLVEGGLLVIAVLFLFFAECTGGADCGVGDSAVDVGGVHRHGDLRLLRKPDESGRTRLRSYCRRVRGDGGEFHPAHRASPRDPSPRTLRTRRRGSRSTDSVRYRHHCRRLHPHLHA